MTYKEAILFLEEATGYGSVLGLESMRELLKRLGNPQDKLKFIHVAGTNGKGSTAAYIANIMAASGYLAGRYISPAVFHEREIIQLTGKKSRLCKEETDKSEGRGHFEMEESREDDFSLITEYISEADIALTVKIIKEACEDMTKSGLSHPTVFEIETAMAFLYFVKRKCDIVVLEVGLGGRLDATNVITTTICAVITSISMDHMHILGDTLEKIAYEKAGIIKPGIPVVSYEQPEEAKKVIEKVSKEKSADFIMADFSKIRIIEQTIEGTVFTYEDEKEYRIRLLGENQVKNGVVAILTARLLGKNGYRVSWEKIEKGLYETTWRGRFELIKTNPVFVIDGAHNEEAAISLAKNIRLYFEKRRILYIVGVLGDKDYDAVLRHTGPLAERIYTITPNNVRALSSDKLFITAKKYCKEVIDAKTAGHAVQLVYATADKSDVIIAFGSLSYLKEVYEEVGVIVTEVIQGGSNGS